MSAKLRLTAFHEAGHAVVMHFLGHAPHHASILADREEGSLGRAMHLDGDDCSDAGLIDLAAASLAGELAAVRAGGDPAEAALGAAHDHELAEGYLAPLVDPALAELKDDALRAGLLALDEAMSRARDRAARILDERWPAVEAVAAALLYLHEIDMDEISNLADGDWTLRDCVILRLEWVGVRGSVPKDALKRFNVKFDKKGLAFWREQWEKEAKHGT